MDRLLRIALFTDVKTDPARLGQNVMRLRLPRRDDLIAYLRGEGNIHQRIAVNVTDLTRADLELRPAKTMRMRFDPIPIGYGFLDLFSSTADCHGGDYNGRGFCEGFVQDVDVGLRETNKLVGDKISLSFKCALKRRIHAENS